MQLNVFLTVGAPPGVLDVSVTFGRWGIAKRPVAQFPPASVFTSRFCWFLSIIVETNRNVSIFGLRPVVFATSCSPLNGGSAETVDVDVLL